MDIADITADLKAARENFLGEKDNFIHSLVWASRNGMSAKEVARVVAPAFGRDQVLEYLAAFKVRDAAAKALAEAGLEDFLDVWVTGIDAPREAQLNLVMDPAEMPDLAALPGRVRDALRDYLITLDLPKGDHDEITPELVDGFLLDGQPVRLVRIEPRV